MSTPRISELGHIGLRVHDINRMVTFYRDVLGLTVTDDDPETGMVFFSARPEEEHHEFLLAPGRNTSPDVRLLQQISFRCARLEDVVEFYRRIVADEDAQIHEVVTHGNAVGVYFFDPEGNRCEVYYTTELKAKQPFKVPIDIEQPLDALMEEIKGYVEKYGATGSIPREAAARASGVRHATEGVADGHDA